MRRINFLCILFALSFYSCSSPNQMNGVFTGGMLGGIFGSSIGGIIDGPRGHDAGNLVGMVVGGVVGAAVTAPPTNKVSRYDTYDTYGNPRKSKKHSAEIPSAAEQRMAEEYDNLSIENLCFIDKNNNHAIDAGEHAKIQFEIKNNGTKRLYDITPVIGVTDNRHILISPTAIVASIGPGRGVKYTAEVYGKPNLKTGVAEFTLGFAKGNLIYTVETFQLNTRSR